VPDDWGEVVKAELSAMLLDLSMKRDDRVASSVLSAGQTDVTDDTDQPPSRN
jgi:hypothetical protein